jgi:hypothetical protein
LRPGILRARNNAIMDSAGSTRIEGDNRAGTSGNQRQTSPRRQGRPGAARRVSLTSVFDCSDAPAPSIGTRPCFVNRTPPTRQNPTENPSIVPSAIRENRKNR